MGVMMNKLLEKVYDEYPHLKEQDTKGIVFILLSCDLDKDKSLINSCQIILKNTKFIKKGHKKYRCKRDQE